MKILLSVIFFIFGLNFSFAQAITHNPKHMQQKFKELEKLKLLEKMDLQEDTAIRFFTRRKNFIKEQQKLLKEKRKIIEQAEDLFKNKSKKLNNYKKMIDQIKNIDEKILRQKNSFINSLNDILSYKQIMKMIVFENKFRREIRKMLIKTRGRKIKLK